VAGFRRFHAINHILHWPEIEVTLRENAEDADYINLIENIERRNLSHGEEQAAVRALVSKGHTKEQVAAKLSRSVAWVQQRINYEKQSNDVKAIMKVGGVPMADIPNKPLTVDEAVQLAKRVSNKPKQRTTGEIRDAKDLTTNELIKGVLEWVLKEREQLP
jgi:hypothetical protein